MRSLGADESQASVVMESADIHRTGFLSFDEFCTAVGPIYMHSEVALRRAFNVFDRDSSGTIDKDEASVAMRCIAPTRWLVSCRPTQGIGRVVDSHCALCLPRTATRHADEAQVATGWCRPKGG